MSEDILQDAIKSAEEQLAGQIKYMDREESLAFLGDPDYDGTLHEIADGAVPVYTSDLLKAASQDNALALAVPELGPAFDGEATPTNIIAANFYEEVVRALWLEVARLKEEIEGEEGEEEDETA